MSRRLHPGGLFIPRPRSVTIGLGIAAILGTISLLLGFGVLFGFNSVFVGVNTTVTLAKTDHERIQGFIDVLMATVFLISVVRALKPVRIPRFISIAFSGLSAVLFFMYSIPNVQTKDDLLRTLIITGFMAAPAILLMSPSANEYYGE